MVGVVPVKRRAAIGFDSSNGTPEEQVARQCLLTRGLIPVMVSDRSEVRRPLHLPTLTLQFGVAPDTSRRSLSVWHSSALG